MPKPSIPLTDADRAVIAAAVGGSEPPGTIVRDFDALLEYFPSDGIPVSPKGHEFALALLPELNSLLTHPAPIGLRRGRQMSYPHVDALQLLLRCTRLAHFDRFAARPRMLLDREMLGQWQALNPIERYFSLLERWWRFGDLDQEPMHVSSEGLAAYRCDLLAPKAGYHKANDRRWPEFLLRKLGWKGVALLQMFAFLDVVAAPAVAGQGWQVTRLRPTPWGRLATASYHRAFGYDARSALFERLFNDAGTTPDEEEGEKEGEEEGEQEDTEVDVELDSEEAASDEDNDRPAFFDWADTICPLVPAWQRSLQIAEPGEAFRGSLTFKVSLREGVWRRIVMPGSSRFTDLAEFILAAFDFDDDHLHEFRFEDRYGFRHTVTDARCSEIDDYYADELSLGEAGLEPGQSVEFVFDFGADWRFQVLVEKLDEAGAGVTPARLAQEGKAPRQYPYDD